MRVVRNLGLVVLLAGAAYTSCGQQQHEEAVQMQMSNNQAPQGSQQVEIATLGAGCFWCVEAVYQELDGVLSVESGYSGGAVANPSYQQVVSGATGHAEVCQIRFDPAKCSYEDVLKVFWQIHDPTTLNRQGNDVGTQYRSAIYYHDERQKTMAEQSKSALDAANVWPNPIVTEVTPFAEFFKADDNHQNYYRRNPSQPYCTAVVRPKLEKFRKVFKDQLKVNP